MEKIVLKRMRTDRPRGAASSLGKHSASSISALYNTAPRPGGVARTSVHTPLQLAPGGKKKNKSGLRNPEPIHVSPPKGTQTSSEPSQNTLEPLVPLVPESSLNVVKTTADSSSSVRSSFR